MFIHSLFGLRNRNVYPDLNTVFGLTHRDNLAEIGKFWLSEKKHGLLNIITSAVLWCIWKLRNEFCFQNVGWRSIETLLFRIGGLLQNWVILCQLEKKELLKVFVVKIKGAA
jgi:hypothetical protein